MNYALLKYKEFSNFQSKNQKGKGMKKGAKNFSGIFNKLKVTQLFTLFSVYIFFDSLK